MFIVYCLKVCAPTGAGKTNIAMLALLQLIGSHRDAATGAIDKAAVKAVYIAPMKALAQEVVAKFSERLKPLGIVVREYTGTYCTVLYCCTVLLYYMFSLLYCTV